MYRYRGEGVYLQLYAVTTDTWNVVLPPTPSAVHGAQLRTTLTIQIGTRIQNPTDGVLLLCCLACTGLAW